MAAEFRWSVGSDLGNRIIGSDGLDPIPPRKVAHSCSVQRFEPLLELADQPPGRLLGIVEFPIVTMHLSTSPREPGAIALDQGWGTCRTGFGFGLKDLLIQRRQALAS
jgi:hypothetical protein